MAYRLRHAWASSIPPLPAPLTPRRNAYRPACSLDCLPACLPTCWPACLPVFARRGWGVYLELCDAKKNLASRIRTSIRRQHAT